MLCSIRRRQASLGLMRGMDRRRRLHAANIFRLLRLFRHGDRPRPDVRPGTAIQFQRTLPRRFRARLLAPLAHDASRFLRDYLYIPLGGNRASAARQAVNVVATMLLGGLWHGANWTFVAWGGLHGIALAVNHVWEQRGLRLPKPAAWLLTLLFVMAAWVLFRSPTFALAGQILSSMAGAHGPGAVSLDREFVVALVLGAGVALLGPTSQEAALTLLRPTAWLAVPAGALLAYLLLLIGGRLPNVFIYFQF